MPRRPASVPLNFFGTSLALLGKSRMWPTLDLPTYPAAREPAKVRAFAGDSTLTSGLGTCGIPLGAVANRPTGGSRPHRGATNRVPVSNIPRSPAPGHSPGPDLSIVSSHAPGGTEPRSQGSPRIIRPLGHDRALPHHLRGDGTAHR